MTNDQILISVGFFILIWVAAFWSILKRKEYKPHG
jgi:hypothetical protein